MPRIPIGDATLAALAAFALDLLVALLVLALGWVAAGWLQWLLRRALARVSRLDTTLRLVLASVARYAMLAFAVLAALAQLGIQTASLLALVGAAGLAIGLALQGALANVAAGLMILLLRPFQVGDSIEAALVAGRIEEIGLFTIELTTEDGVYLSVPNSAVWNRPVRNLSRLPTRQLSLVVRVHYEDDLERALEALRGLLDDPRVLPSPPAEVQVTDLGETAVEVTLRGWTKVADHPALLSDLRRRAKAALAAAGFALPAAPLSA
jgi:small conductance mechanosensitive channel